MSSHAAAQEIPGHEGFTSVLSQVVKVPGVDYAALQATRDALDDYLGSLSEVVPETLAAAGPEVRLAFWVNAYNACMLQRVTDHYPIKKAGGIFGRLRNSFAGRPDNSVWQIPDVFTADFCEVAGKKRSLDEIEHEIVRPMGDPRIHFAVNCAARSCPHLWPEAYTADRVDEQLDRAVRAFIASPQHFRLSREHEEKWTLRLNKVLDWFSDDFGGKEGLRSFLAGYLPDHQAGLVLDPETDIEFFDYDWTLNDLER